MTAYLSGPKVYAQPENQAAAKSVKMVRKLGVKSKVPHPNDFPTIDQALDNDNITNTSVRHSDFMQSEVRSLVTRERAMKGDQCTNIPFDNLEV